MPPYLASKTVARAGRPIEPWKDTLRLMMFVWGGVLLAVFATPLTTDPLVFQWDVIIDGDGTAKLAPLIMAGVGLLSLAIAGIPMSPSPRGLIATLLGLAGILTPQILKLADGDVDWQPLVMLVGTLALVPGLFLRSEYRDAMLPRILVTVGVLAVLAPLLIPVDGVVPLVVLFELLLDAEGAAIVGGAIVVAKLLVVVLSLLAWLPAPSGAGAKVLAWLLLLWGALEMIAKVVEAGDLELVTAAPGGVVGWGAGAAFGVLAGLGLATVLGKRLE